MQIAFNYSRQGFEDSRYDDRINFRVRSNFHSIGVKYVRPEKISPIDKEICDADGQHYLTHILLTIKSL
jgi:hypothetical protein